MRTDNMDDMDRLPAPLAADILTGRFGTQVTTEDVERDRAGSDQAATRADVDTNATYYRLAGLLAEWDRTRQDRIAAQRADDHDREDDLGTTMDSLADEVTRTTSALLDALREGAPLPDVWTTSRVTTPADSPDRER